jgi:hypothetical protein
MGNQSLKHRMMLVKGNPDCILGDTRPEDWTDLMRAVPNSLLRSALFAGVRGGQRFLEKVEICTTAGTRITYTGPQLNQGDLDVWLALLLVARRGGRWSECHTTAYQLLKTLGVTDTGKNRLQLSRSLSRLEATALNLQSSKYNYEGRLINELARDEKTKKLAIRLNPSLSALFGYDQYTRINWKVRHELAGKPLAQWLHGYYSSHANPFPVRVETLHGLCGSAAKIARDFKKDLLRSLESIRGASEKYGLNFNYEVRDSLICINKSGGAFQKRQLSRNDNAER